MRDLRTQIGRRFLGLLLGIPSLGFSADVTGVVREMRDGRLEPLPRVTVIARPADGGRVYASTKTDADGAYALRNLLSPRIQLTARRAGFYAHSAGGHDDRQIVLDCSVATDCSGVDFELRRGAVITGRVVDEIGEPLQDVNVSAQLPESSESTREAPRVGSRSDDRGIFRLAGLQPGDYLLTAKRRRRGPGESETHSTPVEIQVGEGELFGSVELIVDDSPVDFETFSVSGKLVGVKVEGGGSITVHSRARRYGSGAQVKEDGSFVLSNLREGEYEARYTVRATSGRRRSPMRTKLNRFSVDGDRSGLVLQPVAPTGIRGRLIIESGDPDKMIRIRLLNKDGNWAMGATAEAPEYKFESRDFEPGEYRAAVGVFFSRDNGLFVKEVRIGGEATTGAVLHVREGVIEDVEFVLSDDFGKVHGRVKAPSNGTGLRKGAQYTVGLKGPNRIRSVQADQRGRFSFDEITPGEYQICAWEDMTRSRIRSDEAWEEAGAAARTFPVEAGSDIEIDLTAVQP